MEALLYFFSEELTLIENPEAWFVAKKKKSNGSSLRALPALGSTGFI